MRREDDWMEKVERGGDTPRLLSQVGGRKRKRTRVVVWVALLLCFVYRFCLPWQHRASLEHQIQCPKLPITDDILVVLRTGATEALEKLPVHFQTTLRCVGDYVVYSDLDEEIAGHRVKDVLEGSVSERLRTSENSAQEFALYERLRSQGRQGIANASSSDHRGSGPLGAQDNPAWKLDRFKFLPMVDKALKHRPSAKWFVFVEADTYLVWDNLVSYLTRFNHTFPLYIGRQISIGDVVFAHGGTGFVLSNPAMRRVVQHRDTHLDFYNDYTAANWAGDMVLGKILADVDVPLFWAFPHFQGDPVNLLDINVTEIERRMWCYASITYHHMQESEIRSLSTWEMSRAAHPQGRNTTLTHGEVFKQFIVPRLKLKMENWDNFSMDFETDATSSSSFESCKAACEAKPTCLQFAYAGTAAGATCSTSTRVLLGEAAARKCIEYSSPAHKCIRWQSDSGDGGSTGWMQSGWMLHRMNSYVDDMDKMCNRREMGKWVV